MTAQTIQRPLRQWDLTPTCRREILRTLAAKADDYSPSLLALVVVRLTPDCTPTIRSRSWEDLVLDVNLLAEIKAGAVEPQQIWHHIRRGDAHQIAEDTLEQTINEHLDQLVGAVAA